MNDGWFEIGQTGGHRHFKHPSKPGRVTARILARTCRSRPCTASPAKPVWISIEIPPLGLGRGRRDDRKKDPLRCDRGRGSR
ncbi:MAG: type II toxin-antitoxin system HicA family toxin [Pseudomonadota bacterium]